MNKDQENAIQDVLQRMAERIAAGAPRGWKRAEFRGFADDAYRSGHRGLRLEPEKLADADTGDIAVFEQMQELHTVAGADDELMIELDLEAGGRYRAVLSEQMERLDDRAFRYLFDRHAARPEPGELSSAPDATEVGDPDQAIGLLGEYLRQLHEVLESATPPELPLPLPPHRRRELEDRLGLRIPLPRDLEALYAAADGSGGWALLHGYTWLGLEQVAMLCDPDERWWVTRGWQSYESIAYLKDFGPPLAVRRVRDHPAWIPFATDMGGDYFAVDMAPGPSGRPGQVILIGPNQHEGPTYVADSVTSMLRGHVEALRSGEVQTDEEGDGLWIDAGDPRRHENEYEKTCVLEVSGPNAAPIRGLGSESRELIVSNAPWVDLGPVRHAPALWRVRTKNCPGADLRPLRDAPIEVLELSLARIDLSGLEGHPNLQQLVLHTEGDDDPRPTKKPYVPKTYTPVDLGPLPSCPRLYALDLTDAVVTDYSPLARTTGLRYLRMRRPQWEELVRQQAIPPSLAVADLAEEPLATRKWYWSFDKAYRTPRPTRADALTWAAKVAGADADIRPFRGRFTVPRRR